MPNVCTCTHIAAQHLHRTQVCRVATCSCERFTDRGRATEAGEIKPKCKLTSTDGNVFAIIGHVSKTLQRAGQSERAEEFKKRALAARSYAEILGVLVHEYVEVS